MNQKLLEGARGQLDSVARVFHKVRQGLLGLFRVEHLDEVPNLLLGAVIKLHEIVDAALESRVQRIEVVRRDEDEHVILESRDSVKDVQEPAKG